MARRKNERRAEIKAKFSAKPIELLTDNQRIYYSLLRTKPVVIAEGSAGTGKSFLACHRAVDLVSKGIVEKIHLMRPAISADEELGFLPGTLEEKMYPYLLPLYDCLNQVCTRPDLLRKHIEISPIAFLRGRTFTNCVILCDEAQNMTCEQMFMLLTRLGENSICFISGDLSQTDLTGVENTGLEAAMIRLGRSDMFGVHRFDDQDVVRSELVREVYRCWSR